MPFFQKKPVVIEAVRFTGSTTSKHAISCWMEFGTMPEPSGIETCDIVTMNIDTEEGVMTASPGDWIIKSGKGEFYPCNPDIFEATYTEVQS